MDKGQADCCDSTSSERYDNPAEKIHLNDVITHQPKRFSYFNQEPTNPYFKDVQWKKCLLPIEVIYERFLYNHFRIANDHFDT